MAEIHFYSDEAKQNEIYPAIDPNGVYPTTTVGFSNNLISGSNLLSESKFRYRKTGGSENVLTGEATIKNIKGSVTCDTRELQCLVDVNSTSISVTINENTFASKVNNTAGDYTFIYNGSSARWEYNNNVVNMEQYGISISQTPRDEDSIVVHFSPEYIGTISISKPTKLTSIKFNQFNKDGNNKLVNYYIDDNGRVIAGKPNNSINTYGIIWFECLGGNTYTIYDGNENGLYKVAWTATPPASGSTGLTILSPVYIATPGKQALTNLPYLQYYTPASNGYICVVPLENANKLCCHLTGAGDNDLEYEDYIEDNILFDIEYTLKDSNNNTVFPNGLLQVKDYYDEIDYAQGKMYKRIKVGNKADLPDIKASAIAYIYDNQKVYYYDGIINEIDKTEIKNKDVSYIMGTVGTEKLIGTQIDYSMVIQYPLNLKGVIQEVLANKINVLNLRNGKADGSLRNINAIEEDSLYSLGLNAFSEGRGTKTEGNYSHAEGFYTKAKGDNQHVEGKYNIEDINNEYVHIIGNGTSQMASNIHTVDWNGNAWYQGDIYVNSTSGKNKDEGSKKLITMDEIPTIYSGTTQPDDAFGKDGDLFVLIDS